MIVETPRPLEDKTGIVPVAKLENVGRDWLGGFTRAAASEESVGLGGYGKVLTILVSPTVGQDNEPDEDGEENDLIESWTPRFHR